MSGKQLQNAKKIPGADFALLLSSYISDITTLSICACMALKEYKCTMGCLQKLYLNLSYPFQFKSKYSNLSNAQKTIFDICLTCNSKAIHSTNKLKKEQ